jgi:coenzyme PQQ precursor peptide PqqA
MIGGSGIFGSSTLHSSISGTDAFGRKIRLAIMGGHPYFWRARSANDCRVLEEEITMKTWTKPAVREQEVGLEVTSYLPAEIDII